MRCVLDSVGHTGECCSLHCPTGPDGHIHGEEVLWRRPPGVDRQAPELGTDHQAPSPGAPICAAGLLSGNRHKLPPAPAFTFSSWRFWVSMFC